LGIDSSVIRKGNTHYQDTRYWVGISASTDFQGYLPNFYTCSRQGNRDLNPTCLEENRVRILGLSSRSQSVTVLIENCENGDYTEK